MLREQLNFANYAKRKYLLRRYILEILQKEIFNNKHNNFNLRCSYIMHLITDQEGIILAFSEFINLKEKVEASWKQRQKIEQVKELLDKCNQSYSLINNKKRSRIFSINQKENQISSKKTFELYKILEFEKEIGQMRKNFLQCIFLLKDIYETIAQIDINLEITFTKLITFRKARQQLVKEVNYMLDHQNQSEELKIICLLIEEYLESSSNSLKQILVFKQIQHHKLIQREISEFYKENSFLIQISLLPLDFGTVKRVSKNFKKVFGFASEASIIGQSYKKLLPDCIIPNLFQGYNQKNNIDTQLSQINSQDIKFKFKEDHLSNQNDNTTFQETNRNESNFNLKNQISIQTRLTNIYQQIPSQISGIQINQRNSFNFNETLAKYLNGYNSIVEVDEIVFAKDLRGFILPLQVKVQTQIIGQTEFGVVAWINPQEKNAQQMYLILNTQCDFRVEAVSEHFLQYLPDQFDVLNDFKSFCIEESLPVLFPLLRQHSKLDGTLNTFLISLNEENQKQKLKKQSSVKIKKGIKWEEKYMKKLLKSKLFPVNLKIKKVVNELQSYAYVIIELKNKMIKESKKKAIIECIRMQIQEAEINQENQIFIDCLKTFNEDDNKFGRKNNQACQQDDELVIEPSTTLSDQNSKRKLKNQVSKDKVDITSQFSTKNDLKSFTNPNAYFQKQMKNNSQNHLNKLNKIFLISSNYQMQEESTFYAKLKEGSPQNSFGYEDHSITQLLKEKNSFRSNRGKKCSSIFQLKSPFDFNIIQSNKEIAHQIDKDSKINSDQTDSKILNYEVNQHFNETFQAAHQHINNPQDNYEFITIATKNLKNNDNEFNSTIGNVPISPSISSAIDFVYPSDRNFPLLNNSRMSKNEPKLNHLISENDKVYGSNMMTSPSAAQIGNNFSDEVNEHFQKVLNDNFSNESHSKTHQKSEGQCLSSSSLNTFQNNQLIQSIHKKRELNQLKLINLAGFLSILIILILTVLGFWKYYSGMQNQELNFRYINWLFLMNIHVSQTYSEYNIKLQQDNGLFKISDPIMNENFSALIFQLLESRIKLSYDLLREVQNNTHPNIQVFDLIESIPIDQTLYSSFENVIFSPTPISEVNTTSSMLYALHEQVSSIYHFVYQKDNQGFQRYSSEKNYPNINIKLQEVVSEQNTLYSLELNSIFSQALVQFIIVITVTFFFLGAIVPITSFVIKIHEDILKLFTTIDASILKKELEISTYILSQQSQFIFNNFMNKVTIFKELNQKRCVKNDQNSPLIIHQPVGVSKKGNVSRTTKIKFKKLNLIILLLLLLIIIMIYPSVNYFLISKFISNSQHIYNFNNVFMDSYFLLINCLRARQGLSVSSLLPEYSSQKPEVYRKLFNELVPQINSVMGNFSQVINDHTTLIIFNQESFDKFIIALLQTNACIVVSSYPEYQNGDFDKKLCETEGKKILMNGFLDGISYFYSIFYDNSLFSQLTDLNEFQANYNNFNKRINGYNQLKFKAELTKILDYSLNFFQKYSLQLYSHYEKISAILVSCQIIFLLLVYGIVWRKYYTKLRKIPIKTKELLDILPLNILIANIYILQFLKKTNN